MTFSKLRFSREENLKKSITFEEQKGTEYMRGNFYFSIIVFGCISPANLLICFAREIKDFYHGNIRSNVNSDFSIVTMRRVKIIFFELGVVKNFLETF